jgi:hypothetical protein
MPTRDSDVQRDRDRVDDCMAFEGGLTDWERKFIDDIARRLEYRGLTDRESEKLADIWSKIP